MSRQEVTILVVVDENTSSDHLEAFQRHLDDQSLSGMVEASYPTGARESLSVGLTHHDPGTTGRYGQASEAWTVLLHARINELARQCAPDGLRELIDGLRVIRAGQTGTSPTGGLVFLVDEDTGVRFDVEFQLPLQAYGDLENLRITSFRADPVHFDRKSSSNGRWRAPH